MAEMIEIRSFDCSVDSEESKEGKRILTGRAIVFGQRTNIGPFDEIIEQEAITPEVLRDVPLLLNHDQTGIPLARSRNNNENSSMQLILDDEGLSFRTTLDTENNMNARALSSAVDRGDISGMSFMMIRVKDRWENARSEHPVRHVIGIGRIGEISAVTHPAYAQTSIENRGISGSLDSALESLESARAAEIAEERKRKAAAILALKNNGGEKHDNGRAERERG